MAWIASRARKAEIMDKERMIPEKKSGNLDRPRDWRNFLIRRTPLRSRKILKMGQLHLEYDAHDSDLQREEKEEI